MGNILSALHHPCIILDACCVINFAEAGQIAAILSVVPVAIAIENRRVYRREVSRHHAALQPLINSGRIQIVSMTPDEAETAVDHVSFQRWEYGEAFSAAIAVHRNWALATDEGKVITHLRHQQPQTQIITTPDFLQYWADVALPTSAQLQTTLSAVETKGGYTIGQAHALYNWWATMMPNSWTPKKRKRNP